MTEMTEHDQTRHIRRKSRDIGPLGTAARLVVGLVLVGSVISGQLATHLTPAAWALGMGGFPVSVFVWHRWRIQRHPARFTDTGPLISLVGVVLFAALYLD